MEHITEREVESFEGWAIVELMGHRRLGGYVREATLAGAGFLRVDVPGQGDDPAATQFVSPSSLYALTPTTEAMARAVALRSRIEPVQRWELPPAREIPRDGPDVLRSSYEPEFGDGEPAEDDEELEA